jgi:NarL family two-component system response regulator LiaR
MRTVALMGDDDVLVRALEIAASGVPSTRVRRQEGRTVPHLFNLLGGNPDVLVSDQSAWARESAWIRERWPDLRVIVVVPEPDVGAVVALEAGASAVLIRGQAAEHLPAILEVVEVGLFAMPMDVLHMLLDRYGTIDRASAGRIDRLTPREREVLTHLMAGQGHREIADALVLSVHTVRFHMKQILAKLAVHSGLEAAMLGARAGLEPARIDHFHPGRHSAIS